MAKFPITLALGGGGARGIAHLGVIRGLVRAGFTVERIVGVSSGSLAGALFAFNPDIESVVHRTLGYLLSPGFQSHQRTLFGASPGPGEVTTGGVFSWYARVMGYLRTNRMFHRVVSQPALLPGMVLTDFVTHQLPDADLVDAQIPMTVVAVDLRSGHKVAFERGPVRELVRASSSLPGIFPPVELDGMQLCDIGVFYSLPVTVARSYHPTCLVAVDVSSGLRSLPHCHTALDVMMRMDEIGETLFRKQVRYEADYVISPRVGGIEWFDFSKSKRLFDAGFEAARQMVPELRAHFEKAPRR